jgi:hypothetical protein
LRQGSERPAGEGERKAQSTTRKTKARRRMSLKPVDLISFLCDGMTDVRGFSQLSELQIKAKSQRAYHSINFRLKNTRSREN